ncbi:hypothetical protein CF319_g7580 [Tilletia indica]|uniref:Uncharacterized protein n=1 Tax=Tilletia indica TaxID=43049 RepID=A0A177TBZ0_9BASI|nr:hypothetical protein CF319_g7580 [Tilletia indica]KAE8242663.1 hypothetical protein A4X13_0g7066 [Tilletia indica]
MGDLDTSIQLYRSSFKQCAFALATPSTALLGQDVDWMNGTISIRQLGFTTYDNTSSSAFGFLALASIRTTLLTTITDSRPGT